MIRRDLFNIPEKMRNVLLMDAQIRDRVTARRGHLLRILWQERFLTRDNLIQRVETTMGYSSFGEKSWEDTFFRDMRVVKAAFNQAGYELKYSRSLDRSGYYLVNEGPLHEDVIKAISGAVNEIDERQIEIYKKLLPAQKFKQAVSIINFGRKVSKANQGIQ